MKQRRIYGTAAVLLAAAVCLTAAVIPVRAGDGAPVAENLEITTYRGVSCGGQLSAVDPEGDVLTYLVTTPPTKGTVEVEEDGSFVYTPKEGKRGKDYFGYVAEDPEGNRSQEATVIIRIEKQKKGVSYSDMKGSAGEYAALLLSEEDVFTGEQIGGEYCFYPDRAVTRGEFLSMCMIVADEPVISAVMNTGYSDDEDIPAWMKPYVTATVMKGMDSPASGDAGRCFQPEASITRTEAVTMLNQALGLNDVSYIQLDTALQPEVAQACANLTASGILRDGTLVEETMSRMDAAELLSKALELMSRR